MLYGQMLPKKIAGKSKTGTIDIRSVASHARVSIATVSRVMNNVPTVNSVLAARVWKTVKELKYTPNTQARALVSGKSRLIGLIVSEITNPFFPELIQEFERVAVQRGYEIILGSTNYDSDAMASCVRRMLERKVEGLAVMTFGMEQAVLEQLAVLKIPMVYIDKAPEYSSAIAIPVDYYSGILDGVQHLAVLGHRDIAFISGPHHLHSARARQSAFIKSLEYIGVSHRPEWVVEGDHTLEGGRDAMRSILAQSRLPTAVMCSNDMTAIGVQHSMFEANLQVPDDISLIGFDDIHLAGYTIPPLTTIRMSCQELAQQAMRCILSQHDLVETVQPHPLTIRTKLVVRRTTGLPKNALLDLKSQRSSTAGPLTR